MRELGTILGAPPSGAKAPLVEVLVSGRDDYAAGSMVEMGCYSHLVAFTGGEAVAVAHRYGYSQSRASLVYEMKWGCDFCGSVMAWRPEKDPIPRKCTSCGAPRKT